MSLQNLRSLRLWFSFVKISCQRIFSKKKKKPRSIVQLIHDCVHRRFKVILRKTGIVHRGTIRSRSSDRAIRSEVTFIIVFLLLVARARASFRCRIPFAMRPRRRFALFPFRHGGMNGIVIVVCDSFQCGVRTCKITRVIAHLRSRARKNARPYTVCLSGRKETHSS